MKKGINFHSLPKGRSYAQYLRLAKDAGFDGIELATRLEGELNLFSSETEFTQFRSLAEQVGIELPSTISMIFGAYSPTSPDPSIREKTVDLINLQIRAAAWLGASATLVVPGFVTKEISYQDAYQRSLQVMRQVAPVAEQYKVSVGIENIWNKFLLSPLEFRQFVDEVGSPYVGSYFDVGNILYDGFPEQWVSILGKRIVRVHVKDYKIAVGNGSTAGFTNLLQGDVDYPAVMAALRQIGYNGYLTAELTPYPLCPEQLLYDTSAALDAIIKM